MRDRNLERNIERVEEFVELWKQLSGFLDRGFKGGEFSGEEESAFLELKSKIAQQHEVLSAVLGSHADHDDRALRLLNTVPSLAAFKELPDGMGKRIAGEWHTTFISLQGLLGRLKGQKARLSAVSSFRVGLKGVLSHPVMIVLIAAASMYGVYKFAYEWLPKIMKEMETTK
jgi:hypothetical protein